jgi:uncharacterized protein YbjT (DUF2867 family)
VGKTAIIFGVTGLTGSKVLSELVKTKEYSKIVAITRKTIPVAGDKIQLIVDDFSDIQSLIKFIKGDEIFCCLGTTLKKAGSKNAFLKTDFDLQYKLAVEGRRNGVNAFYLISSLGANSKSFNYYLKTKGRLEEAIVDLKFDKTVIFRPSLLLGKRKEFRLGENISKIIFTSVGWLFIGPLKKYKAIQAEILAKSMISAVKLETGIHTFESDKIKLLAKDL